MKINPKRNKNRNKNKNKLSLLLFIFDNYSIFGLKYFSFFIIYFS